MVAEGGTAETRRKQPGEDRRLLLKDSKQPFVVSINDAGNFPETFSFTDYCHYEDL